MLNKKNCILSGYSLEPFGKIICALCFRLSLKIQSLSASSTTNTRIELPDDMTRSDQANSKNMIRACIDKIIEKRRPRVKCRLSDEELVLLALTCCADEWLSTSQSDELAFVSILSSYNQHESFRDVLKKTIKARVNKIIQKHQSRTKCRLSDGLSLIHI